MIVAKFILGALAMFVAPIILLRYSFPNMQQSLHKAFGLVTVFTFCWIIFLVAFYFEISGDRLFWLCILICIFTLGLKIRFRNRPKSKFPDSNYSMGFLIWVGTLVICSPLLLTVGDIFTEHDAVVSWNRWAMEFAVNDYHPMSTAYPVLFPAIWSVLYKIQGTTDIWWTAKTSLFLVPVFLVLILANLYRETKNPFFLIVIIFSICLTRHGAINGYMDVPVMLMGILTLSLLRAAECYKDTTLYMQFIIAAILIAGVSSIIKQPGIAYLLFVMFYIFLNRASLQNKTTVLLVLTLSCGYFLSFLGLFLNYESELTGNIYYLKQLSEKMRNYQSGTLEYFYYLKGQFTLGNMGSVVLPIMIGLSAFTFRKDLRMFSSIGALSAIFFMAGLALWVLFFSYSGRNSMWVKSFLIASSALTIENYLVNHSKYYPRLIAKFDYVANRLVRILNWFIRDNAKKIFKIFVAILFIIAGIFTMSFDNITAYRHQDNQQKLLGDQELAKFVGEVLTNSNDCKVVVSNSSMLNYNYHVREVFEKIVMISGDEKKFLDLYEANSINCNKGYYWAIDQININKNSASWIGIENLEKTKKISRIYPEFYFYFVPVR